MEWIGHGGYTYRGKKAGSNYPGAGNKGACFASSLGPHLSPRLTHLSAHNAPETFAINHASIFKKAKNIRQIIAIVVEKCWYSLRERRRVLLREGEERRKERVSGERNNGRKGVGKLTIAEVALGQSEPLSHGIVIIALTSGDADRCHL